MSKLLGVDTSNYTTSVALLDIDTMEVLQEKKLLPVKKGEKGIRQSDAVFHHTNQLPELVEKLFSQVDDKAWVCPMRQGLLKGHICHALLLVTALQGHFVQP